MKNSSCYKTKKNSNVTKHQNSICEKTHKFKLRPNSKTQIVTKLKKLKLLQKSKTKIVTKSKWWGNSKTQIMRKLKKSNWDKKIKFGQNSNLLKHEYSTKMFVIDSVMIFLPNISNDPISTLLVLGTCPFDGVFPSRVDLKFKIFLRFHDWFKIYDNRKLRFGKFVFFCKGWRGCYQQGYPSCAPVFQSVFASQKALTIVSCWKIAMCCWKVRVCFIQACKTLNFVYEIKWREI